MLVAGMADGLDDVVTRASCAGGGCRRRPRWSRGRTSTPRPRQEVGAGADLAGVGQQVLEDEELARGQRDRALAAVRRTAMRVERQPARADEAVLVARVGVAEAGPHARDELGERERLGQVVGRPELQAAHLGGRRPRAPRARGRAGAGAARIRLRSTPRPLTPGIIRSRTTRSKCRSRGQREPCRAVGGALHRQAVRGQRARHELGDPGFVVDDEDARHGTQ